MSQDVCPLASRGMLAASSSTPSRIKSQRSNPGLDSRLWRATPVVIPPSWRRTGKRASLKGGLPEKVEFFEKLGLPLRLLPRRIYYGVAGNQKRYFALKLPLAVDAQTTTFVYIDPGHQMDRELHSWGAAHGPLWDAFRKKGQQVRGIGIGVENAIVDRTARVLEKWAAAKPGTSHEGLTPKQEIKAIREAMKQDDWPFFDRYGGRGPAMKRVAALSKTPEANLTEGVSIDDYSTWQAVRFVDRDQRG